MEKLKPNEQRAKTAVLLIWIIFALEALSLISNYFEYELLKMIANGGEIELSTANENDLRQQLIAVVYIIAYVISAVAFIQWFRRAYFNLHTKIDNLTDTEGWAAGAWFIPIISLYKPYQIMKEMYERTAKLLGNKLQNYEQSNTNHLLGLWWTLWIINNILEQVVFRYSEQAETIDELLNSSIISMLSAIIGIPLAIITVRVIKQYAVMEPLLHELDETVSEVAL
jgi:hypothetical protein